jgi:hypothetical protein
MQGRKKQYSKQRLTFQFYNTIIRT